MQNTVCYRYDYVLDDVFTYKTHIYYVTALWEPFAYNYIVKILADPGFLNDKLVILTVKAMCIIHCIPNVGSIGFLRCPWASCLTML